MEEYSYIVDKVIVVMKRYYSDKGKPPTHLFVGGKDLRELYKASIENGSYFQLSSMEPTKKFMGLEIVEVRKESYIGVGEVVL